jgi:predicted glycosyltransferase
VKVVCSLRDIPGRSSFDPCIDRYSGDVLDMLHTHFDQLLIHADPRIVRLDEQIDWANRIEIPLTYTGYVSQKHQGDTRTGVGDKANVIVSAGGTGSTALLSCAIDAWKLLAARSAIGERTMALFLPLSSGDGELARLQQQASGQRIRVLPYTTKFLAWLARAELSISNAGYNTCTNILETRVRSILVANRQMSDQALRCERFAQMGLARTLEQAELTAERLADAILEQLDAPAPEHDYHLDGAEFTRGCLEHLLGRAQIHQFRMPNPLADSLGRPPGLRAG